MPSIAYRILAAVLVAALVGWGGYRTGRKVERADWLELEQQRAVAAAESARLAAQAEIRRTAAVATAAVRVQTRVREVKDATPIDPHGARLSDAERLRLDALYDAYFADATPAGGLHGRLPAAAPADGSAHGSGLDRVSAGLGLRLPGSAQ